MTRLVLHIGAHKTGTSLLQKYMRDNEKLLFANGLVYISRSDMNGYVGWGRPLLETPELFRDRITSEAKANPGKTIVASQENTLGRPMTEGKAGFYPDSAPRIEALERVGEDVDLKIIYYIRGQWSFVESYYLQLVHQGSFTPFDEWYSWFEPEELSWSPLVSNLRQVFGEDAVTVADFGEIAEGQNKFVERFLRRVDPSISLPVSYGPSRNRSISEKGLRIALAANPHLKTAEERSQMRKFLQKHFSNVDQPRPVLLSDAQKSVLRELFESENKSLEIPASV